MSVCVLHEGDLQDVVKLDRIFLWWWVGGGLCESKAGHGLGWGWAVQLILIQFILFTTARCVPRPRHRKLRHLRLGARGAAVPAAANNSEREVRYK